MGKLMRDKYRLGFVDVGGWDTHVNEGAAQGALANNLDNLGRGLQAFPRRWARSGTIRWWWCCPSSAARSVRTAIAAPIMVTARSTGCWAARSHGGRIAGEQQRLQRGTLFQDRDYPVLNDYRAVLAGLFRSLWSLSPTQCDRIFQQVGPLELSLV